MQESLSQLQLVNTINNLIKVNPSHYQWYYVNKDLPEVLSQRSWKVESMGIDKYGYFFKCPHSSMGTIEIKPTMGFELYVQPINSNKQYRVFYQEDEGSRMLIKALDRMLLYIPERAVDLRKGCINRETQEIITQIKVQTAETVELILLPVNMNSLLFRSQPILLNDYVSHFFIPLI